MRYVLPVIAEAKAKIRTSDVFISSVTFQLKKSEWYLYNVFSSLLSVSYFIALLYTDFFGQAQLQLEMVILKTDPG